MKWTKIYDLFIVYLLLLFVLLCALLSYEFFLIKSQLTFNTPINLLTYILIKSIEIDPIQFKYRLELYLDNDLSFLPSKNGGEGEENEKSSKKNGTTTASID